MKNLAFRPWSWKPWIHVHEYVLKYFASIRRNKFCA